MELGTTKNEAKPFSFYRERERDRGERERKRGQALSDLLDGGLINTYLDHVVELKIWAVRFSIGSGLIRVCGPLRWL